MTDTRYGRRGNCAARMKTCPLDDDPNVPLAMAYIKDQTFCETFDPARGLRAGTIFPQLYKPFLPEGQSYTRRTL